MTERTNDWRTPTRRGFIAGAAATGVIAGGFPWISNARAAEPIKLGIPTIMSGRVAQLGISSTNAVQMVLDVFNAEGGLDGRPVEMLIRDSRAKPDEAARVTRGFVNSDKVDVVFNCEASSASFAVQEVVRESGTLCLHNVSETSSLSADPAIRSANSFRFARQGIHDAVGSAGYAARIAQEKGLTKWMSVSPDYAYGRDNTQLFFKLLKRFGGDDIEVLGGGWPKLFQPDYTEVITQILQRRPDAIYSALWGGDLVSFIDQATLYGMFEDIEFFTINLADHTTMSAVNDLPNGMHSGTRYLGTFPDTESNRAFDAAYVERFDAHPTNWSWECKVSAEFLLSAMREAGSADGAKVAEALRGMTRPAIVGVGPGGTATMRAEDQTLINYAIGWGTTVIEAPFMTGIQVADWADVIEHETAWKTEMGYI